MPSGSLLSEVLQSAGGSRLNRRKRSAAARRREENHVWKARFPRTIRLCVREMWAKAIARIAEGAAMIRTKGEAGSETSSRPWSHAHQVEPDEAAHHHAPTMNLMHQAKELSAQST